MKNIILLCVILFLMKCDKRNENVTRYPTKGIPDLGQGFSFMYFPNETEGYLFGTLSEQLETSEDGLNNPKFVPTFGDEANIYKTVNGGRNWKKIISVKDYVFYNIATTFENCVYILMGDMPRLYNAKILRFNLKTLKVDMSGSFMSVSAIWNNATGIQLTTNGDDKKLYSLSPDMKIIDSNRINNSVMQGLYFVNDIYAIFNNVEACYFGNLDALGQPNLLVEANSDWFTLQDENKILIAGAKKNDNGDVVLISYNTITGKSTLLKEFRGYSVIDNLQSNDKVICGFIGNIKGIFVEYDLIYSFDKGNTWQMQKLEENRYIQPACLIGNILYIYSGNEIQKIKF